jgi:hypothetical protein
MSTYTANIEAMNQVVGYDVVIVCTSTEAQAAYWQERLLATRGQCCPTDCKVIGVNEDWNGGAGNGLGTLYAYHKAVAKATELYGEDISEKLAAGAISVGLYHTAGKVSVCRTETSRHSLLALTRSSLLSTLMPRPTNVSRAPAWRRCPGPRTTTSPA